MKFLALPAVVTRQPPEVARDSPQLRGPVRVGGVDLELFEHDLRDA
jgi:hypothetical protein